MPQITTTKQALYAQRVYNKAVAQLPFDWAEPFPVQAIQELIDFDTALRALAATSGHEHQITQFALRCAELTAARLHKRPCKSQLIEQLINGRLFPKRPACDWAINAVASSLWAIWCDAWDNGGPDDCQPFICVKNLRRVFEQELRALLSQD